MINRTADDACPSQAEIFVEKEAMLDKKTNEANWSSTQPQ